MRKLFLSLAMILLIGCVPEEHIPETDPEPPEVYFKKHITLHSGVTDTNQDVLKNYDIINTGYHAFKNLKDEHKPRTAMFFNIWAASEYKRTTENWQPAPGDVGDPEVLFEFTPGRSIAVYTWSGDGDAENGIPDSHVTRFLGWIEETLENNPTVGGIFLDDWASNRFWWSGSPEQMASVWPGYPEYAYLWSQIKLAERLIHELVDGKIVVCNGPGTTDPRSIHFHEGVGEGSEPWTQLLDTKENGKPVNPARYVKDGNVHMLEVNAVYNTGLWTGFGVINFRKAVEVAELLPGKIYIGVSYTSAPEGQSQYSYVAHPQEWKKYLPTSP